MNDFNQSVLDQNLYTPVKTSPIPIAIRYGLLIGGAQAILMLLMHLAGMNPAKGGAVQWVNTLLQLAIGIGGYVLLMRERRDKELGGYLSLGQGIGVGTLTGVFTAIISVTFFVIFVNYINPNFISEIMEVTEAKWEEQGMKEEQMEQARKMMGYFMNIPFMATTAFFSSIIGGAFYGLVIGAIMRRQPPIM